MCQMGHASFESMVGDVCREILGLGTLVFSEGRDGGRDGKFSGTAARYPSDKDPWSGDFIIQAKHTSSYDAKCNDNEFYSNKTSVINKEIDRLNQLIADGVNIDNYLVFTNRSMSGGINTKIVQHIKDQTKIPNVELVGRESLIPYLNGKIKSDYKLHRFTPPMTFSNQDVADVVIALKDVFQPQHGDLPIEYIDLGEKNRINGLGEDYYSANIKPFEHTFHKFRKFFGDPRNLKLAEVYTDLVVMLNHKIFANREEYCGFESVFDTLVETALENEPLRSFRPQSLVLALFLFAYWHCDLGIREENATATQIS